MSDVATFEFQTNIDLQSIRRQVSKCWMGEGHQVDVYTWKEPARTFCVLEYFFGKAEEPKMLFQAAKCLLELAKDNRIYYYRCIDFVDFFDSGNHEDPKEVANYPLVQINVIDLLLDSYQPSMSAHTIERFIINTKLK